ncbi:hypothetical protein C7S16_6054 [Burkholderia thailandensis]|uniref:Uncharacterized protein n=1 Tax=Burkholderia thailandensis TaxID=57975 RepID=A0AAW9CQK6_BURTH|nr:hypothetical protein [Burkholderia thailandensis]MDW9252712.1 hypothetical protein [Burkholderia thailandensis]
MWGLLSVRVEFGRVDRAARRGARRTGCPQRRDGRRCADVSDHK